MLVLSRKLSQQILIGDAIRITVVGLEGGRVRLGIDAPPEVSVLRSELRNQDGDLSPEGADGHGRPSLRARVARGA